MVLSNRPDNALVVLHHAGCPTNDICAGIPERGGYKGVGAEGVGYRREGPGEAP